MATKVNDHQRGDNSILTVLKAQHDPHCPWNNKGR